MWVGILKIAKANGLLYSSVYTNRNTVYESYLAGSVGSPTPTSPFALAIFAAILGAISFWWMWTSGWAINVQTRLEVNMYTHNSSDRSHASEVENRSKNCHFFLTLLSLYKRRLHLQRSMEICKQTPLQTTNSAHNPLVGMRNFYLKNHLFTINAPMVFVGR
jgi:hypothetical protein